MKNLTITVDDSVLEWARIEAARRGASVSRMVGDFMAEMQRREDAYERAYLAWRTDERSWRAQSAATAEPAAAVATAAPALLPRDATAAEAMHRALTATPATAPPGAADWLANIIPTNAIAAAAQGAIAEAQTAVSNATAAAAGAANGAVAQAQQAAQQAAAQAGAEAGATEPWDFATIVHSSDYMREHLPET